MFRIIIMYYHINNMSNKQISKFVIYVIVTLIVCLLLLSSLPELAGPGSDDAISVCLVQQISIHRS